MSASLLESARSLLAGLLDLGRTRFELFGTELREELWRLAAAIIGVLSVMILASLGLAFGALGAILYASEPNRPTVAIGVATLFAFAAGIVAWRVRHMARSKPRAFDATLSELQRDLDTIKP